MMQNACVSNSSPPTVQERVLTYVRESKNMIQCMCFRARVDDKRRHGVISSSTRRMAHTRIATRSLQFFHPFDLSAL